MTLKVGAGGVVSRARAQYAPTLTAHDPNPPLPIETATGQQVATGVSTETSAALALSRTRVRAVGLAVEADQAQALAVMGDWPTGRTLHLNFSDVGTLTLTGALIDQVDDQSGNARHFTASGSDRPTSASDATIGQAAVFDASSSNVMTTAATFADLTAASAFTIVVRCTFASVASLSSDTYGDGVLFIYGAPGGVFARQNGAGYRAFGMNDDGGWPPDEAYVAATLDTEMVLVVRHTGGNVEIRDGAGSPATAASGDSAPTTETWRLGNAAGGGNFLDGAISHVVTWDRALSEGEITAVLAMFAGGFSQAHGVSLETSAALALTKTKIRAAGVAAETDAAQTIARTKVRAAGVATETNAAITTAHTKVRTVSVSLETDAALALAPTKLRTVTTGTEVDAALAVGRVKLRAVDVSTEASTALSLTHTKIVAADLGQESSTALSLAVTRLVAVTTATETDTALAASIVKVRAVDIGAETDAALSLAVVKARAVDIATETDAAIARPRAGYYVTTTATETDTALQLGRAYSIGTSAEVGIALTLDIATGVISIGVAVETSTAFALSRYPPRRPRASAPPAWARNGLQGSLPLGFWRRWL